MIALACDHGGFAHMRELKLHLDGRGVAYKDFGTYTDDSCDYPEYAEKAARAVVSGECSAGILICGTGIGMSIAANKIPGVRAALCSDCFSAEMTRRHNDANVLTLGARVTGAGLMLRIVDIFLDTGFDGGRHARRVGMIGELERSANCQDMCQTPTETAERRG
ncbi:MAG: ribose 5-phosphate isomerase B [Oscillospiraceae bacterium]|jgi:ribose 5-phosphate isomerase B|nr:ribose 5-phosphate isomerase B [Oscillospiraceae bacterium]